MLVPAQCIALGSMQGAESGRRGGYPPRAGPKPLETSPSLQEAKLPVRELLEDRASPTTESYSVPF